MTDPNLYGVQYRRKPDRFGREHGQWITDLRAFRMLVIATIYAERQPDRCLEWRVIQLTATEMA